MVGETGRYPIMFEIIINMLKYYKRKCSSEDVLLMNAYKQPSVAHEQDKISYRMCQSCLEVLRYRYLSDVSKLS